MAITAGMAFSSSAFQNIGQASPVKIGAILIPLAWFLWNLIGLLIFFLREVVEARRWVVPVIMGVVNLLLVGGFALLILFTEISYIKTSLKTPEGWGWRAAFVKRPGIYVSCYFVLF